jgi:hypothetical protein
MPRLPITSYLIETPLLRIDIDAERGLERPSQNQVDKPHTPCRERIDGVGGRANDATIVVVNRALMVFPGLV